MQRSGPFPLIFSHILASLAVLAAVLVAFPISSFVYIFTCDVFSPCPTPAYFARAASTDALWMLPCVALAALGVFALHCLDTHQTGRALFVFLFFLVGGLVGIAVLYGLAQLAPADLASKDSVAVYLQAANWFQKWTLALYVVAIV
jgi:hypothetical protein